MERIVVLAGSLREANAYCRDKGIRALFVKTSAQMKNATTIIELPGFGKRRDRFTLEQARDSRLKFGRHVEYTNEADWVPPEPMPTEAELEQEHEEGYAITGLLVEQLDLTDEETLTALKVELNKVGLTLKKLPPKKTEAEAPVVDAPVEF